MYLRRLKNIGYLNVVVYILILILLESCFNSSKESPQDNFQSKYGSGIISGPNDSTSIKWETTYFEFGLVKRGPDIEIEYPFKNTGDKPLVIDSVTVTCGCTLFQIPEKPIDPGKSGKIRIKFVSSAQPIAIMEKHIYIKTNTKAHPYHTLAFKIELTE